jgi:hypothetical protein
MVKPEACDAITDRYVKIFMEKVSGALRGRQGRNQGTTLVGTCIDLRRRRAVRCCPGSAMSRSRSFGTGSCALMNEVPKGWPMARLALAARGLGARHQAWSNALSRRHCSLAPADAILIMDQGVLFCAIPSDRPPASSSPTDDRFEVSVGGRLLRTLARDVACQSPVPRGSVRNFVYGRA